MNSAKIITLLFLSLLFFIACEEKPAEENIEPVAKPESVEIKTVPVEVDIVKSEQVVQNVKLTGVLNANKTVEVFPEVAGKVEQINAELGDRVSKGDTIAYIDSDVFLNNYLQAEAQVLTAENALEIAEINLKSDEALFKAGDISKLAFDNSTLNVKSAKANLLSANANLSLLKKNYLDTRVISPISGYVARRYVDLGTMVNQAAPAYRIVDISKLKVSVGIPQKVIDRAKKGNVAKIVISTLGDAEFEGILTNISPQADNVTGTFPAEITLNNTPENRLKPGMTCEIFLTVQSSESELVVPEFAIVKRNGNSFIYTVKNNIAVLTEIEEGISIGNKIVINSGLNDGDKIVITGINNLGEKTPVTIEN